MAAARCGVCAFVASEAGEVMVMPFIQEQMSLHQAPRLSGFGWQDESTRLFPTAFIRPRQ